MKKFLLFTFLALSIALGGTITIAGRAGEGTSVVARIPIDGNSALSAERGETIVRPS